MSTHAWMTIGAGLAFALVWAGLLTNVIRIARRDRNPPRFQPLLASAHLGRFAGWALIGASTLHVDPLTGGLLLATRIPAVVLLVVTFLQRRECRPSARRLARWIAPTVGGMVGLALLIAHLSPTLPLVDPPGLGAVLPEAHVLHYGLNAAVVFCFAVQLLYALPLQIRSAVDQPLGNLRWFQLGQLANYAYAFVYAAWVIDPLAREVMRGAYGLAFAEQLVLVALIERGVRRLRHTRREVARDGRAAGSGRSIG